MSVTCPICQLPEQNGTKIRGSRYELSCKRCGGPFTITDLAVGIIAEEKLGHLFSAWIRTRTENGQEIQEINRNSLDSIKKEFPKYDVPAKLLLLLGMLKKKTDFPGQPVWLTAEHDYPTIWATNSQELSFFFNSAVEQGLIQYAGNANGRNGYYITTAGWVYLYEQERATVISDKVFVAMWFDPSMDLSWENGIRTGIENAGFNPVRIDEVPHNDSIPMKILAAIKESRFVVVDFTTSKEAGQRGGVYFEAGYALGLGLPVISCVRKDWLKKIHFDYLQYNHIVWETPEELADKLKARIEGTIGKGNAKKKS